MALNSIIRKIPLKPDCDFAKFNQDIHQYKGFAEINSLFLNKRLVNWLTRTASDSELGNGVTFTKENDHFNIFKDNAKIFEIENKSYKTEVLENTPEGLNKIKPVTTGFILPDGTNFLDENNVVKYEAGEYTIYLPLYFNSGKVGSVALVFKGKEKISTIEYSGAWKYGYQTGVTISILYLDNAISYDSRLGPAGIFLKDHHPYMLINSGSNDSYAYYDENGNVKTSGAIELIDLITGNHSSFYRTGMKFDLSTSSYQNHLIAVHPIENGFMLVDCNKELGTTSAQVMDSKGTILTSCTDIKRLRYASYTQTHNLKAIGIKSGEYSESGCPADVITEESEMLKVIKRTARARTCIMFTLEDGACYLTDLENVTATGTVNIPNFVNGWPTTKNALKLDTTNTTKIKYTEVVYRHNCSKLYGKWALNYRYIPDAEDNTKGEFIAENIAHDFKKLVMLENGVEDVIGYDDNSIYFKNKINIYRLYIDEVEAPLFQFVGDSYIIFNTTSYLNTLHLKGSKNEVICSCDDWNDRALFYATAGTLKDDIGTSRLGNNYASSSDVITVSEQIPPSSTKVAAYNNEIWTQWMRTYFVDSNYTSHPGTKYTVYLSEHVTEEGTEPEVLYKRGYILNGVFNPEDDETDIYTDAEDSEINPFLLMTDYYASGIGETIYVRQNGATYKLIVNQSFIKLLFLDSPEEITDASFYTFQIHGSSYTFYSDTGLISDENGNIVCNANMFHYIGQSTKCAYFFSVFDNSIYLFQGDNTMAKTVPLEKYEVKFNADNSIQCQNIPSLDLVIINLGEKACVIYGDQICLLSINEQIDKMSINQSEGTFQLNNKVFSLVPKDNTEFSVQPIKIETEYYGLSESNNTINDCVYLTVDNFNPLKTSGTVKIKTKIKLNNKITETPVKEIKLTDADFTENVCIIKYQPPVQECLGFKLILESDFEIYDISIGTSAGAMVQSQYKI